MHGVVVIHVYMCDVWRRNSGAKYARANRGMFIVPAYRSVWTKARVQCNLVDRKHLRQFALVYLGVNFQSVT